MTPYTKKIVELHKIHKAIEEKDCCNGGGSSDDSSKEITIDDVVKFIHDKIKNTPVSEKFPYTTWNDIPDYDDANSGDYCKTNVDFGHRFVDKLLSIPSYIIGLKGETPS